MTLIEALAELHRRNCRPDRHDDACLALTAGFDELVEQRDLARRVAVALEQENCELQFALNRTDPQQLLAMEA